MRSKMEWEGMAWDRGIWRQRNVRISMILEVGKPLFKLQEHYKNVIIEKGNCGTYTT